MADPTRPFEAYRGDEDFIFVSYAHADATTVYPDLVGLKDAGFNIWYDEGISPGSRWTAELADAIENCTLFIAFLSPNAVASENCTNEVEFAVGRKRPILVVHTEPLEMPGGLELSLGGRQAIMKADLGSEAYQTRLTETAATLIKGGDPFVPRTQPSAQESGRSSGRPMMLAAAIVLMAGLVYLATLFDTAPAPPPSDLRLAIAVRPFETGEDRGTASTSTGANTGTDNRFFADGIADDLVMRLGHWRTLPVIARGSSFAADLPPDPVAAGAALNARYLVEGSVTTDTTRGLESIKLAVYLVDAASGRNVWSEEYVHSLDEAIAVQSEIADSIVTQINPALISAETRRAVRADPANLDAWSAAMRGWWHLNTETQEGLTEAQVWFEK